MHLHTFSILSSKSFGIKGNWADILSIKVVTRELFRVPSRECFSLMLKMEKDSGENVDEKYR
jgi:hypothetical protein